jgi:hypothetical protein
MGELRKHERISWTGKVAISWIDGLGTSRTGVGECVNLSSRGMQLRLRNPIDVRGYVYLQCKQAGLHGSASVRSCNRHNQTYVIGVEFEGGMKFVGQTANS